MRGRLNHDQGSGLPHEAPNPVSKKTASVHNASLWRGYRVAARGARAAGWEGPKDRISSMSLFSRLLITSFTR
jgi:hypothetical protein